MLNALCAGTSSSSVRAITVVYAARFAPVVNHLRPLITQSSPSSTARVWSCVGSELATSGSVIAKLGKISPATSGLRYFSRHSGDECRLSMIESCSEWVPRHTCANSDRPTTSFT